MIGIIAPMHEELNAVLESMKLVEKRIICNREFHIGTIYDIECVCVISLIGKVAAATTMAILSQNFDIEKVMLIGTAGGLGNDVNIGDIVIGINTAQHDMDCTPIFPQYEIPLYGKAIFEADQKMSQTLLADSKRFAADINQYLDIDILKQFKINKPSVHQGLIISGDTFIKEKNHVERLKNDFENVLAVEMEGAAVAQVCHDLNIPFCILRIISDNANSDSHVDFKQFIHHISLPYIKQLLFFGLKNLV